jgi:D-sedoheptulose 7-phosphate isomerase
MQQFVKKYIDSHLEAISAIPLEKVNDLIGIFNKAWDEDRQIFVAGNGGSASNCSHFITDLGKSASDKLGKRFRCFSLNENVSWITAIGNDYKYEDIYQRQLYNYAKPGDLLMCLSVSGNSPNLVNAFEWAKSNGVYTIALTGSKKGRLFDLADFSIVIDSEHYGRVEDAQMTICHMVCYYFVEGRNG